MNRKLLMLLFGISSYSFAGVHVMNNDSPIFSTVTVTGLRFSSDGSVVTSTSTFGSSGSGSGSGSGTANYGAAISGQTTITVSSTTHGFNTTNLVTECWDTSVTPRRRVEGYETTVDGTTYSLVFTFPSAFTGTCAVNGTGASSGTITGEGNVSVTGTWPNYVISGSTPTPNYPAVLSSATSLTISSSTHGFATRDLVTECWDTSVSPNRRVEGYETTVDSTTYSVVFTFPTAFSGRCIVNGASSGGSGGSGGGASLPIVLTTDVSGVLPVANGGSGSSSPSLVAGSNVTVTGTWPNQTIAASGGAGGSGASTDHEFVVMTATSTLANERVITSGQGISITDGGAGNSLTISADTAVLLPMIRTSFSYDFGSITNNTCVLSSTQTFSGSTTGSTGIVSAATSLPQGVNLQQAKIPAANQVAIEICNHSGSSYDPSSMQYTATLITVW